ncbi:EAL domain-containing protein [Methylophilus sp. UBA6697]|uniref:EAL domain-containing protein n=1 Tax=Methylophilus sp. UBA6697 TaxID=1946902 RepID=UPI0025E0A835|nr:EAL domain-containing protein [Methylophilus sp. UBA6697]
MSLPTVFDHHSTAWLQPLAVTMPDTPMLAINRRAQCLAISGSAKNLLGELADELPKEIRQLLVEAIREGKTELSISTQIHGAKRDFKCRVFYPQSGRRAIGLMLEEEERTLLDQLLHMQSIVHSLIEMSPDLICIKDNENRWMMANQHMLNTFQIDSFDYQFLNNLQIADTLHPVFRNSFEHHEKSDQQVWKSRQAYHNEELVHLPQGGYKTLEVNKVAYHDQKDQPSHLITVARDVSEQKFIQTQLLNRSAVLDTLISCDWMLHSAERWQSVAENVLQQCCLSFRFSRAVLLQHETISSRKKTDIRSKALFHWAMNGFHATYEHWEKISFLSPELQRWYSLLSKGQPVMCDALTLPASERALLKSHDTVNLVIVPLMIDDEWWGSMVIERCFDAENTSSQELGSLMAIGRTLSVAIDREQTGKHLKLAKIAFDSTTEGIMIVNPAGELVGINQGYTLITGFEEAEVLGTKPQIFRQRPRGLFGALKRHGKWSGEIENMRKNGDTYTEWMTITAVRNHANAITNYVGVFADISEMKRSQTQLNSLVNHDPLTGLPNRRLINHLFTHAIQRANRNEQQAAVLFIDLDRFKNINDSLGHYTGDQLLLGVTERLRATLRESDIVGRLGGDEFIILLENLHGKADAAQKAHDILDALRREFMIDHHEIFVGASIGISMYPHDGNDVESLIKAADLAMYQVKNNGKNHVSFYDVALSRDAVEHFQLETELRQALTKNQLKMFYQAQIDLNTGMIIGAEALIRWIHPVQGIISPAKFIPLAEETGLILSIGEWALAQAVRQAHAWHKKHPEFKKIAINVSGVQIMKSKFADTVYGILMESECDPSIIELEITESTLMQHTQHVVDTFNQLKLLGVSIAIDDFGTGYSSLSHLKRLPLDQIKIDRSFVKDLPDDKDDAAITSAIYAMATQLGFTVVAEGVETEEQEKFLQRLGCQTAQGYLYAYPVNSDDFLQLLVLNNQRKIKRHA